MAKNTQALLFCSLFLTIPQMAATAEITPDNTLDEENSVITPVDELNDKIEGGAKRGSNLFHSFREFNIGKGRGVDFVNPSGVENILTRVTGNNLSKILGRLGVLGEANLFLINPNGIIFGEGARLDVSGSFIATTADGIKLGKQGIFSASSPETSNLLTVQPSALFFNQLAAGQIINRSQVSGLSGERESVGLSVSAGKTLALIGGEILLKGGNLTAPGGRIELGSVAGGEEVSLSQVDEDSWVLGYEKVSAFQDILLKNAKLDVSSNSSGDVQIQGRNLEMNRGSYIFANNRGKKAGSEILIKTTNNLILAEKSKLTADVFGRGEGNNISLDTNNLIVRDDSVISAITYSKGNGGDIDVTAQSIELTGNNPEGLFGSILFAESGLITSVGVDATGNGGDLTIETNNLLIKDGAQIGSGTFGEGNGGKLSVTAQSIELIGNGANIPFSSGLYTAVGEIDPKTTGNAGNLTIDTQELIILDGAAVFSGTFAAGNGGTLSITAQSINLVGESNSVNTPIQITSGLFSNVGVAVFKLGLEAKGSGGNININTENLIVRDGAQVFTNTAAKGNAGDLSITAESIEVVGRSSDGLIPSNLSTTVDIEVANNPQLKPQAKGNGGELTIDTDNLIVRDGAVITTGTLAKGNAGNLTINAQLIEVIGKSSSLNTGVGLEEISQLNRLVTGNGGELNINTESLIVRDGAEILASSFSRGKTGDINITAKDLLFLQQESQISTTAGARESDNDGGSIKINTDFLVALPNENSDIAADAFAGMGGNIDINAVGIFGIEARENRTPQSDITASSQADRNLNGQINLSSLGIEPSRQLFILPTQPLNAQIAQTCTPGTKEARSELIFTGKGGIAPNNLEALQINPTAPDWVELSQLEKVSQPRLSNFNNSQSKEIIEAQGWIKDENGELVLVADASNVTPHDSWQNRGDCHGS
ncbi:MAG: filamentous hemagglutinin N-terminal domain-containing protein [Xenococcaceae cyanobacterium]